MKVHEKEMYPLIASKFEHNYIVKYEVPLLGSSRKIIDVVCLSKNYMNTNNPELIAIEAKIKDWRKVIKQAFTRLFVADKVYIALYEYNIPNNFLSNPVINSSNIGVISVNGRAKIIKESGRSQFTMQNRKRKLIASMIGNFKMLGD